MARVLIVCADRVGANMAGPAIRCWEMARLLVRHGHDVHLAVAFAVDIEAPGFDIVRSDPKTLAEEERWADVIVVQGFVLSNFPVLSKTQKHLVVDLYDPFTLETLEMYSERSMEYQQGQYWPSISTLLVQLRIGDFFLCASERQRDLWLGSLLATNRVNPETLGQDRLMRHLVAVAPFGTSSEPPRHSGEPAAKGVLPSIDRDAKLAIWAGGVYNWFDPQSLLRAWPDVMRQVPEARLLFLGMRHPNPGVPETEVARRALSLASELKLRDRGVVFNMDWVPYDRRQDYLLEADLGVSMHAEHLETRFSFRTRFLDYIWAGLPMVATEGDSFADWVGDHAAGRVVPYEDPHAISEAVVALLGDGEARTACRQQVLAHQAEFTWERALAPLVDYCADPWLARDTAGHKDPSRTPGLRGGLQPPSGLLRRALWFRRKEGTIPFVRRAARKAVRSARQRARR